MPMGGAWLWNCGQPKKGAAKCGGHVAERGAQPRLAKRGCCLLLSHHVPKWLRSWEGLVLCDVYSCSGVGVGWGCELRCLHVQEEPNKSCRPLIVMGYCISW